MIGHSFILEPLVVTNLSSLNLWCGMIFIFQVVLSMLGQPCSGHGTMVSTGRCLRSSEGLELHAAAPRRGATSAHPGDPLTMAMVGMVFPSQPAGGVGQFTDVQLSQRML